MDKETKAALDALRRQCHQRTPIWISVAVIHSLKLRRFSERWETTQELHPSITLKSSKLKQRDMNKVKKAIRSLNPVIRMTIIAVLAATICISSGFFFGSVLGITSASALFVLVLAATFFVVGVYIRLIEDDDE